MRTQFAAFVSTREEPLALAGESGEGGGGDGGGGGGKVPAVADDEKGEGEEKEGRRGNPTSIYRVINGFAHHKDLAPIHVRLVGRFESEKAAFVEVARLCGHIVSVLPKSEKHNFYMSMRSRYIGGNYISPYVYMKDCADAGVGKLVPSTITTGILCGEVWAPLTTQYVVAIDDDRYFPWGEKWVRVE